MDLSPWKYCGENDLFIKNLRKTYFPHNILRATSPPTYQSLNKNAKVLVLVTDARPYLPESFWRRTPKSTRLNGECVSPKRLPCLVLLEGLTSLTDKQKIIGNLNQAKSVQLWLNTWAELTQRPFRVIVKKLFPSGTYVCIHNKWSYNSSSYRK